MAMSEEQAKEKAQFRVFVDMNRGDIEDECARRGIRIVKSRSTMEQKLIKALTKEYMEG